ncbi:IclR family transcriptional regulator [Agrobacterium rhizogenes]|uniref:IclR family transcriptional regulator n=1 Tax=Rhizobium rhizogenes NBRC 13257 TaxID=1220581 RepID=A0AA87QGX5_RHIRH|nr:IclR family transcriptional regulator [Rhizobium rhizogenes]NTF59232.1 IclR family transcriptional regulator [Rhizobium rhizogenes]NTF78816.1 IclR family transcriptional regulator [Rhizobium rhizogenes]NTF96145.1 IclR family transcriptional regulator [Rhizobium rhizogenes]NTG64555.1 IclR family transcriptional regulator [Rhizobium rhizogenes]NTG71138.1 IclR family transcriptional regulator [Rhizobium rhizogenes]
MTDAFKSNDDSRSGIQVIARAAAILRSLKNESDGLSLGQIAERVGLPRSTVQRIVGALQAEQFVIAASPERGIRLGPEIGALAESARIDVLEMLRPYLVDLARRTKETVDLAVFRSKRLVFVDQIPGTHRLRTVSFVGESFPLCDSANGKACLAKLSDKQILARLAEEQPSVAEDPVLLQAYQAEVEVIRETGIAFDRDQHTVGISAVGAAFYDLQGDLYAISVPTPSSRFQSHEKQLTDELSRTLAQIVALEIFRAS